MISSSHCVTPDELRKNPLDCLLFGLGYETRSTYISSFMGGNVRIYAIQMPESPLYSYKRNLDFAKTRGFVIVPEMKEFLDSVVPKLFERGEERGIRVGIDISSLNRLMMIELLLGIARHIRPVDEIKIF